MTHEIEVTIRIRVQDEVLKASSISPEQFASNMILFEHQFDIPSVVLSQDEGERDPVERWSALIVKSEVFRHPMTEEEAEPFDWSIADS
jgi:hypothetical protein